MKFNALDIIGQIADLKEIDCKNTTAIAVLVDLLIDKGLFTKQEFALKARQLEMNSLTQVIPLRRINSK